MNRIDVALVNPPFWPALHSSLALGLLQGGLEARGYRTRQFSLYLDLVERLGIDPYLKIGELPGVSFFLGDWVFAEAVFGPDATRDEAYFAYARQPDRPDRKVQPLPEALLHLARDLRDEVPAMIARWADALVASGARIFAFSNVFQQAVAGIAVARALKQRLPDCLIVFGGANCEGPAGRVLIEAFGAVDVVVNGEGDLALPAIVKAFLEGKRAEIARIPGCITSETPSDRTVPAQAITCLDDLPEPVYRDLYADLAARGLSETLQPSLVFETSRGCWWGAKHHCTFCGINAERMAFRAKSPETALRQLKNAVKAHRPDRIFTSDNIMDVKYLETFVPMLAEAGLDLDIYYELKSNLKRQYLATFREAGILSIQPGIEALDDDILALIDKGAHAGQHVRLLKGCDEEALECNWNLLFGFPGERAPAYQRTLALLPLLTHLPPPADFTRFVLLRFSPYFERGANYGIKNIIPDPAYRHVYALDDRQLHDLAYYFTFQHDAADANLLPALFEKLSAAVAEWKKAYHYTMLMAGEGEDGELLVLDTRDCAASLRHRLDRATATVARAIRDGATPAKLFEKLEGALSKPEIAAALETLTASKMIAHVSGQYIFLPVEIDAYAIGGRQAMPALRAFKRDAFYKAFPEIAPFKSRRLSA
ncbi:RiPP maturation radical SAM protein 1 [Martelella alba]|uniref:RiPP maturation radical SAM protein 1 n=1 Tax=Martelella alba TaxID=2590451 RepID=A0A506U1I2_9HYPH|nr:RiPP maturation radical SAM C-methyltransferase [Martelella alba]TPW28213.1 RiPP maturation radical SAM protein 1 [Martelella alba]